MGILSTILAAAVLATAPDAPSAPATTTGPVDFVAPDGSFSARFPAEPTMADGAWASRVEDRECAVLPMPMERDADKATSDMILNMMLAQLETMALEPGWGGRVSMDSDDYAGKPARGFVMKSGPSIDEHKISKGRLVRTDTHLLMIFCDSPKDTYDEAAVTAFVDSLRLPPAKQ